MLVDNSLTRIFPLMPYWVELIKRLSSHNWSDEAKLCSFQNALSDLSRPLDNPYGIYWLIVPTSPSKNIIYIKIQTFTNHSTG